MSTPIPSNCTWVGGVSPADLEESCGGVESRHAERQGHDSLQLAGPEKSQRSGDCGTSAPVKCEQPADRSAMAQVTTAGVAPGPHDAVTEPVVA